VLAFPLFLRSSVRADRSGSVAAEFALIVPLLTTLLLGIIEFGTVFFSYSAMQFAANNAARQMAVNVADQTTAIAAARDVLPGWARDDVAITVVQSDPADPNRNVIRVRMVADARALAATGMLTRIVPWTLTADASIKQELPYVD
jgi:Flp pilus assembly protein TadG